MFANALQLTLHDLAFIVIETICVASLQLTDLDVVDAQVVAFGPDRHVDAESVVGGPAKIGHHGEQGLQVAVLPDLQLSHFNFIYTLPIPRLPVVSLGEPSE